MSLFLHTTAGVETLSSWRPCYTDPLVSVHLCVRAQKGEWLHLGPMNAGHLELVTAPCLCTRDCLHSGHTEFWISSLCSSEVAGMYYQAQPLAQIFTRQSSSDFIPPVDLRTRLHTAPAGSCAQSCWLHLCWSRHSAVDALIFAPIWGTCPLCPFSFWAAVVPILLWFFLEPFPVGLECIALL